MGTMSASTALSRPPPCTLFSLGSPCSTATCAVLSGPSTDYAHTHQAYPRLSGNLERENPSGAWLTVPGRVDECLNQAPVANTRALPNSSMTSARLPCVTLRAPPGTPVSVVSGIAR